ncbi:flp pilus-assembly TadE/G-like family protein [Actinomyces bowdenii]|uniref:Rv3654c family TadE-like protein n=1 Tax=Actinomyces bowdenii TaxID=131109 RepID=UPI001ABC9D3C|nr:flp pilus-assembly TadE/G-like family protein [Actinomyces bowdenii]
MSAARSRAPHPRLAANDPAGPDPAGQGAERPVQPRGRPIRCLTRRPDGDETGAGTVMALAIIAVALSLGLGAIGLIQAQGASGRARSAADLAALAGATALSSVLAPGDPCATAERVARANGARLTSCRISGEDVSVDVVVPVRILGLARQAGASARAGPVNPLP